MRRPGDRIKNTEAQFSGEKFRREEKEVGRGENLISSFQTFLIDHFSTESKNKPNTNKLILFGI